AFDTLYFVLETTLRLAPPLLPLMSEVVWAGLTGEESVHLVDWLATDDLPHDDDLVETMEAVRDVCSTVSSIRKAKKLRVRLPLNSLVVAMPEAERLRPSVGLIAAEVNVLEVHLTDDVAAHGRMELAVNPRGAGRRHRVGIRRVRASAGGRRSGVDGRPARRGRAGRAGSDGDRGAGGRGLGQGPGPGDPGGQARRRARHHRSHPGAPGGPVGASG